MYKHLKQKKIIVAVANTIVTDSRVIKCAETLKNNAYDVLLIGVGDKFFTTKLSQIPLTLVREIKQVKTLKNVLRKLKSLAISTFPITLFLSFLLFCYIISFHQLDNTGMQMWFLIGLVSIISAIIVYFRLVRKRILLAFSRYIVQIGYSVAAHNMAKELRKYEGCIVHAHDMIALIAATNAKKTSREMVIIWDAHEIYTELSYKSEGERDFIHRAILECAPYIDYFVTINSSIAAYYAEHYPGLPSASVIMNATRQAVGGVQQIDYIRSRTNIANDQKVLLFQGGLSENRGINQLLNAARELPNKWSLVFMGDGKKVVEISAVMKKLNEKREMNRPAIRLIPTVPLSELNRWTSSATLGAITYENSSLNHYLCTPNKLWEYPNAGVPVVATDLPELKKIVENHKIGFLLPTEFNHRDILQILDKITDSELEILRQNCYKFNKTENWEKYESILLKIYSEAQLN